MINDKKLVDRLTSLSPEGRLAFAASCCERMIPNFEAFVLVDGVEDTKACQHALNAVWKWVSGEKLSQKQIEHIRSRCQEAIADPEMFDSIWSGLATNAVSAIMDALDCCLNGSPQSAANTAILANDSIYEYISKVDKPFGGSQIQEPGGIFDKWIMEHPLKKQEFQKQEADFDLLALSPLNPDAIRDLRRSAQNFGVQPFRRRLLKNRCY